MTSYRTRGRDAPRVIQHFPALKALMIQIVIHNLICQANLYPCGLLILAVFENFVSDDFTYILIGYFVLLYS